MSALRARRRRCLHATLSSAALVASTLLPCRGATARNRDAVGQPGPEAAEQLLTGRWRTDLLRPARVALLGDTPYSPADEWRLSRVLAQLGEIRSVKYVEIIMLTALQKYKALGGTTPAGSPKT